MNPNFRLRTNAKGELYLNVFDFWSSSVEDFIRENSIDYLYLSSGEWKNLLFLENIKNYIKKFRFYTHSDSENLEGLTSLSNLIFLSLEILSETPLDFSFFPQLQKCTLYWNKNFSNNLFNNTDLENLSITYWQHSDFYQFSKLENLKFLDIAQSKISNLEGISQLKELETLILYDLRNLVKAKEICNLTKLQDLRLGNCKKINNLEFISSLTSLKKLELYSMGKIESLDFLKKLNNLEFLNFEGSTVIENGNLTILTTLPKLKQVVFNNRKHYSHKSTEINAIIKQAMTNN
ncbi:MAG: hypothetical protein EWV76_09945 [Microcystis novacekii Mn_MB_F_20050700_S1]|uniref:Disease resistance R13L4/SHOC-2-like LRR domain-containing protein n=1 Tax=Microcystis novacekii Mn_MB_F_20050700_S1D TaxID=2486266 RepID=A0A552J085_9CHRO|nr:MAG: hypothetical protein EWV76_09945 [Microcystis novacekii Mn_MB_F_20050700_S1]TRU89150.1 MAG: hypothetical protein EWV54_09045 [Microcystis novacekii Mn_MB_F_20050700_S1D]